MTGDLNGFEGGAQYFDAVVVGAGFAGLNFLYELRKHGFSCKVFEAGSGVGGVWHWNCYPGARVDSIYAIYQFHYTEVGADFHWNELYPGWTDLQNYFQYVDRRHNFSRDIQFNTKVIAASFNSSTNNWKVTTSDSAITYCRYFILCVGVTSKLNRPKFPGLDTFRGKCFHTGDWVADRKIDFKNKRVAVIGTGPSGVQVVQEIGPEVEHLTVFQRTPNLAVPMQQRRRGNGYPFPGPAEYPEIQDRYAKSHTGLRLKSDGVNCLDVSPEERRAMFEKLYAMGGFALWRYNYQDILFNLDANKEVYKFWRQKTIARLDDPVKQELLAPEVQPHPFGAKRPSLETAYFEVYNQPNVDLVDIRTNKIAEVTENGIRLENGRTFDVDIIVLATGFDAVTGGIYDIDIENSVGKKLKDHWQDGVQTLVGLATTEFPNMFFLNGPHGTAALSIVALTAKLESEWIVQMLVWMRLNDKRSVEPKQEECQRWTQLVHDIWYATLFPFTNSWYQGANIPGKRVEPLSFIGGTPAYVKAMEEASADEYAAFNFN